MWIKLVRQIGICLILILTLTLVKEIDHPVLNDCSKAVLAQLEKNYTMEDVKVISKKAVNSSSTLAQTVAAQAKEPRYGKPIDQSGNGETAMVYAVEDGEVSAVGENHKIGKFVKITHGKFGESIYGNCEKIYVKELETVKKGQIIATFQNGGKTEFYYSLSKLR